MSDDSRLTALEQRIAALETSIGPILLGKADRLPNRFSAQRNCTNACSQTCTLSCIELCRDPYLNWLSAPAEAPPASTPDEDA